LTLRLGPERLAAGDLAPATAGISFGLVSELLARGKS
jgi:hypothetical protein